MKWIIGNIKNFLSLYGMWLIFAQMLESIKKYRIIIKKWVLSFFFKDSKLFFESDDQNFIDSLKSGISDCSLSEDDSNALKAKLLLKIERENLSEKEWILASNLRKLSNVISIKPNDHYSIRRRVLSYCFDKKQYSYAYSFITPVLKPILAIFVFFVFGFGFLNHDFFLGNVTMAEKWSYIEQVQGGVFVNRAGEIKKVDKNFILAEGDIVFTEDDGFVSIRFLDESFTRLSNNSSLIIRELYFSSLKLSSVRVNVALSEGRAWNSVKLLDEGSNFLLEAGHLIALVSDRATFEVSIENGFNTNLKVYDNAVEISSKKGSFREVRSVISGYSVKIEGGENLHSVSPTLLISKSVDNANSDVGSNTDSFIDFNKELDRAYSEKIISGDRKAIDDYLLTRNSAFDDLVKSYEKDIQLNKSSEEKALFDEYLKATRGFFNAEKLLLQKEVSAVNKRIALSQLYTYKAVVRKIVQFSYADLAVDSSDNKLLLSFVKESMNLVSKHIFTISLDDKLHPVKKTISDSKDYFYGESDLNALLVKMNNNLYQIERLINDGKIEKAKNLFNAFLHDFEKLIGLVDFSENNFARNGFYKLLNENIAMIESIKTIENKLYQKGEILLAEEISRFQKGFVKDLLTFIKKQNETIIPFSTLQKLNSLIVDYSDFSNDDDLIFDDHLFEIMKEYPEYKVLYGDELVFDITAQIDLQETQIEEKIGDESESIKLNFSAGVDSLK